LSQDLSDIREIREDHYPGIRLEKKGLKNVDIYVKILIV